MDRRSWLCRRKSSEKSPGETESSGSVSSLSERFSDDHEASRVSPNTASPNFGHSPDVSSKTDNIEVNDTVNSLTEKLSAALSNVSAKEELVKQHAKVTEEAVSGWEKAENEVVLLKQQLEAAFQKNSALEDRIGHLDGALKECVRELRQSREEQEQKIREVIINNSCDWESQKLELESRMSELRKQLEAAKAEAFSSVDHDLRSKLEQFEKENSALKLELVAQAKDLQMLILERDLSTQAAETASKHLLQATLDLSFDSSLTLRMAATSSPAQRSSFQAAGKFGCRRSQPFLELIQVPSLTRFHVVSPMIANVWNSHGIKWCQVVHHSP